jgi:hypothetical protein
MDYKVGDTAAGYAVWRPTGGYAEFLGLDEAEEAARLLESGEAREEDYVWVEE